MEKSTSEIIGSMPALTKIAAVFFVIGKVHFIPAAAFALVDITKAWIFTGVYVFCIVMAIVLTLIDIARLNKLDREEKKAPPMKEVEKWAKEYGII